MTRWFLGIRAVCVFSGMRLLAVGAKATKTARFTKTEPASIDLVEGTERCQPGEFGWAQRGRRERSFRNSRCPGRSSRRHRSGVNRRCPSSQTRGKGQRSGSNGGSVTGYLG